jgi:hypothetical protein
MAPPISNSAPATTASTASYQQPPRCLHLATPQTLATHSLCALHCTRIATRRFATSLAILLRRAERLQSKPTMPTVVQATAASAQRTQACECVSAKTAPARTPETHTADRTIVTRMRQHACASQALQDFLLIQGCRSPQR